MFELKYLQYQTLKVDGVAAFLQCCSQNYI
jgi:hypothetical protein